LKLTIANPYWDLHQQVKALQREHDPKILQTTLTELNSLSRLSFLDRSAVKFLIKVRLFANRLLEEIFFVRLREKYAYSAPSPKLLRLIAEYSPLIEMGAGNGYLASLLRAMGADIVALDAFPVEEGNNWFFNTVFLVSQPQEAAAGRRSSKAMPQAWTSFLIECCFCAGLQEMRWLLSH